MNGSIRERLRRLEHRASPRSCLVLYQDDDDAATYRDPGGGVYRRDGPGGVLRDATGTEASGDPLILVTYVEEWPPHLG